MSKRRFPGINPFQTEEQDRFFGRDDDIRELHALLLLEKVVVLFGKSGHGKSSLLNAGIVPRLQQEKPGSERRYEPAIIKFGAYVPGKTPPAEAARQFLSALPARENFDIGNSVFDIRNSLWTAAKQSGNKRIVLIFDQFEEFFTYPLAQQQGFAAELGELLNAELPPELAARYAELPEDVQDFLAEKLDVKTVFAIREDRLHLLDKLKYPLPAIFARRYALLPLPRAQAREALAGPAALKGDFDTPAFSFSEPALEQILDFLADPEGRVETNQLQILAESFEKRAETEAIREFTPKNLGALKSIVADYYHERIAALPTEADRLAARRLCEEGLVQDGEPPVRLNLHEAQIANFYAIAPGLLEKLVASRLLRAEPGAGGGYTYELPHDTLLEPVLDARRERLEAEEQRRQREAAEAAERRAREAEALATREKRRRQRANLLTALAFAGLIIAAFAGWWATTQKNAAEQATREAERQLVNFYKEKIARQKATVEEWERKAAVFETANRTDLVQETRDSIAALRLRLTADSAELFKIER